MSTMIVPVTALKCFRIHKQSYIISGEGCMVKVYNGQKQHVMASSRVFPRSSVVHGFTLIPSSASMSTSEGGSIMAVYGQKMLKIIKIFTDLKIVELSQLMIEKDWILDVNYIPSPLRLIIMYAHNYFTILNYQTNERTVIESEVKCILYSACLGYVPLINKLMIASGTVFNDVLVHCYTDNDHQMMLALTLRGHEGVIFDVNFNTDFSQVVSVSDDRTIRVWRLPVDWYSMRNTVISSAVRIFRGHVSRVWSSQWITPTHLISIGEDATARIWDNNGCIHVVKHHKGSDIWSMCVDRDEGVVVTGGGDCGIHQLNYTSIIAANEGTSGIVTLPLPQGLTPRVLCLVDDSQLLCLTDNGTILSTTISSTSSWEVFSDDNRFSNYAVMTQSEDASLIALGSLHGVIKIILVSDPTVVHEWSPCDGKVYSLTWLKSATCEDKYLLSCGPNGVMHCWHVSPPLSVNLHMSLILPASKHRWVTCALYLRSPSHQFIIICGDRKGSIHMYTNDQGDLLVSYRSAHGCNGVTSVCYWKGHIYSTGRDGYCRQFRVKYDELGTVETLELIHKFHPVRGIDWIHDISFTKYDELILQVFHGRECRVYSYRHGNELINIDCGGGHRSSAMTPLSQMLVTNRMVFYYIKGSSVYGGQFNDVITNNIIKESFIGRECVSMCHIHVKGLSPMVAIGSEDCTITILSIDDVRVLKTLSEHVSVVKSLTVCTISDNTVLMFSGGGRASIKSWILSRDDDDSLCVGLCTEHNIHNLPARPSRRTSRSSYKAPPPECRIMSLTCIKCTNVNDTLASDGVCLVAGCSDGIIRVYLYSDKCFNLIGQLHFHNRCILSVKHSVCHMICGPGHVTLLYTCSTDGSVAIWDCLSHMINGGYHDDGIKPVLTLDSIHQSGINDISILTTPTSDNTCSIIIASVGDDTSVHVTTCMVKHVKYNTSVRVLNKVGVANAHHSSITGVVCMDVNTVVTSSIDQRLSVWKVTSTDMMVMHTVLHNVADPSSLLHIRECLFAVCGIGFELVDLSS